jgi:hypothetical protein
MTFELTETFSTTYHTFRILLYRALTEEGHLRRHTDPNAKRASEQECIASALAIERYVRAYRKAYSLRRVPFLLCYAVYSAVAIILPQERHDRGNFTSIIAFFWTCLGELQQGCNLGLKKPLSVLRDMAREFELSSKELGSSAVAGPARAQQEKLPRSELGTLDESCFPQLPLATQNLNQQPFADAQYLTDFAMQGGAGQFGTEAAFGLPGSSDFLNDQEWGISQNTLYGLFAPFPQ